MATDKTPEEPRVKRKYTKRAKMLLRSNNDYIDHKYWDKMYAKSKKKHASMMAKYGAKSLSSLEPAVYTEQQKKELAAMGIGRQVKIAHIVDAPLRHIPVAED